MADDLDRLTFAPGTGRLAGALIKRALLGKADAETLAAETTARIAGDTAAAAAGVAAVDVERTARADADAAIRRDLALVGGAENVRRFGVVADGVTDDTANMQAALASGRNLLLPPGNIRLTGQLTLTTPGQVVAGAGRTKSVFRVNDRLPGPATSVFRVACPGTDNQRTGPTLQDFGVLFHQSDDPAVTGLATYQPAILVDATPRTTLRRVRLSRGTDGLRFVGNCGNSVVEDLECACYGMNIFIDGCTDTMRFVRPHIWPFDMTPAQSLPFYQPSCLGLRTQRCDGLVISDGLFLCGLALQSSVGSIPGLEGSTFGSITNTGFDLFCGFYIDAGFLSVSGCYFSLGGLGSARSQYGVAHLGGDLVLSGCQFVLGEVPANAHAIRADAGGAAGSARLTITGCNFLIGNVPGVPINATALGVYGPGTTLALSGGIVSQTDVQRTGIVAPLLNLMEGGGTVTGVAFGPFLPPGSGAVAINTIQPDGSDANRPYAIVGCDGGGRAAALGTGPEPAFVGNVRFNPV